MRHYNRAVNGAEPTWPQNHTVMFALTLLDLVQVRNDLNSVLETQFILSTDSLQINGLIHVCSTFYE